MKRPEHIPAYSKALLAGALTGIAAAIVNCVYDIVFRGITRYLPAEEFGFFQITLASVIVLMLIGMLLYLFVKNEKNTAFAITIVVLGIACVCITAFLHANKNETAFYGNHGLIAGFVILSCLLS